MNIFTFSNLVRFTQQCSVATASLGLVCLALIGCETAPETEPALQTATLALGMPSPYEDSMERCPSPEQHLVQSATPPACGAGRRSSLRACAPPRRPS